MASLHRVSIASILSVASVPSPGDCRWLTRAEVLELYQGLGLVGGGGGGEKDIIEYVLI